VLKIACVAQIVNVISWLHTCSDGMLKHPSYYAFKLVSNYARGEALDVLVKAPTLDTAQYDAVPALDISASFDAETQQGAIFMVNRSQTDSVTTWQDGKTVKFDKAWQIAGSDPKACNTWDAPEKIVANAIPVPVVDKAQATITLPPMSFTVLTTHAA
jgi:alpha-N-arabinofuranosidase